MAAHRGPPGPPLGPEGLQDPRPGRVLPADHGPGRVMTPQNETADCLPRGMRVSPDPTTIGADRFDQRVASRRDSGRKVSSVTDTIEHPDIRYVVYPVHLDGSRTGEKPRLRHDPDCSHFEWRDGTILGTPEPATEE